MQDQNSLEQDHMFIEPETYKALDQAMQKALLKSAKILKDPIHTNVQDRTVTAAVSEYRDPLIDKPPRGVDMNVLTRGGIHIRAQWRDDMGFIAWSSLPSTPQWAKDRLNASYLQRSIENYNNETKEGDPPCPLADPNYPNI